ncbi:C2 domain-containing protein [Cephalotus follicularis]|uniref:C2 domain-containing protein n=1 Tax=Cephalotus follicularis TaxID=3775 RepID=A0A1Q3B2M6_CEPFO|nr:C2 domain-containing protein [Cephalotus follicularis]
MDSYSQSSGFLYNQNPNTMVDAGSDSEFSGILEIYVHHARNIHNICIYENQDVYAKFSLTYNPDETLSTTIINRGGKNPEFNQNLVVEVTQVDAVLKCEIWMLSRARNYMEDQLLGFALVPISQVVGKGKVTEDYSLSSTDLFHSPAGTVQLTISLNTSLPVKPSETTPNSSISSEVVLLDRKISQVILDPVEYSRLEFPDLRVARENQQMVSDYFGGLVSRPISIGIASFLHLGSSPQPVDDYEMNVTSFEGNGRRSISPNGSIQNSGFLSSTTTSLSDDRNSSDSTIQKKNRSGGESSNSVIASSNAIDANQGSSGTCPSTPTSKKGSEVSKFLNNKEERYEEGNVGSVAFAQVFSTPLGNINLEAEQSAMQQQIVDMYMRSMHQFTESLAKMKLPMDLDKLEREEHCDVIQNHNNNRLELEKKKKKDGSRVFYGSRAFF